MSAPWTPKQVAMVKRLAGNTPPAEIARRISAVGPERNLQTLYSWASRTRFSLRTGRRMRERGIWPWSADEDAALRRLAGHLSPSEIADALNRQFFTTRGPHSIRKRRRALDISLWQERGLGMMEMARTFRLHNRRIVALVDAGLLRADRRGTRGGGWAFLPADIEACLRAHPYLVDWRRVAPGPWRDLARAVSLRSPYLSVRDTAERVGVRPGMVQKWIRQGRVTGVVADAESEGLTRSSGFRIPLHALDQLDRLAVDTFGSRREVVTR